MILALYQPDIPQNAGTLARLASCLGIELHIIAPAGFALNDKAFRRAGLDYLDAAVIRRHADWAAFGSFCTDEKLRLILLTTKADTSYLDFSFGPRDILLLGRESAGVPDEVHRAAQARLRIPMHEDARSLNVAVAAAMVVGEALRQTKNFPPLSG